MLKTIYSTGETWEFGDGGLVYKNGQPYQMSTPEGRATYNAPSGGWGLEFQYTDHLGNTRVSFRANNGQLEKVAETAFDPWGVVLNGLGLQNATQNRFEFLNREKESTFGLNTIRLGARGYNPTIGRFDRIDPVTDSQENYSTYQYSWNNPVLRSDPDGKCPLCPWIDAVVDVGSVLYDAAVLIDEKVTTGTTSAVNWAALGADAASILVPMTVGAGAAVRAGVSVANKADNVADALKTVDKVGDTKKTYQTYTKEPKNSADGVYSGKTSGKNTPEQNISKRDKNHHMNDTHGPAKLDKSSSNPDAIRGREQRNIKNNGGAKSQRGTSGNKINGVSPDNKKAQKYDDAAQKEFGN